MAETTVTLGGKQFTVGPMPWGRLKSVMSAINRVGLAAAAGVFDDAQLEDMATVLQKGLQIEPQAFDELPTTIAEVLHAFNAVVKASGLEEVMGEALRAGLAKASPAIPPSTPGIPSTPT